MVLSTRGMPLLFGAFGFVIVLFLDLRRRRLTALTSLRLPVLALLDLLASPLTAGLALALLVTVCPEAYRSGVLKLTSSAVVALALCVVVLPLFWTEGRKQIQFQRPVGLLFAEWLIFAGGLAPWIESRLESSLETVIDETIDLLYSDSHLANREAEIRRLLPQLDPRGVLVIHDASSHFKLVREAALRLEAEGLISAVLLSTPRGVVIAQRREGRQ